jgi:tetratricopeptide (TPR) repeat protein
MEKKTIIIIIAIILALAVLGAGGWYFYIYKPACNVMRSIAGRYDYWRMQRLAKGVEYGNNYLRQYLDATARITKNPDDGGAYADLGAARAALKDYAGAEADYSKALELDGDNISVLNSAADFYTSRQNYPKAEECYFKVLNVDPAYAPAYQNLVALYNNYYTAKKGEIEKVLLKGLESMPNDQNLLALLASYYMSISGEWDKAIAVYERMLSLRPNDALLKETIQKLKAE